MSEKPQYILVRRSDLRELLSLRAAIIDMGYNVEEAVEMMVDTFNDADADRMIAELNRAATNEVVEIVVDHGRRSLPHGLCGNREAHAPHHVDEGSMAPYWCTADQSQQLPFVAEKRRSILRKSQ